MDLSLLATLKEKLIEAEKFADVFSYFLDHFGEQREFIALGERTRHDFLENVLSQIGQQIFGRPVEMSGLILTRLADQQFIHGGGLMNGSLATVIFFEDINVGLAAIAVLDSDETKFARFSARPLVTGIRPSMN
jgi:hypothetical protein